MPPTHELVVPDGGRPDAASVDTVHAAVGRGDVDALRRLLEAPARAEARRRLATRAAVVDNQNVTPLHLACRTGDVPTAALLIEFRAALELPPQQRPELSAECMRRSPLIIAAERDHAEVVSMLLTKQANINCRPSGGAPDHTGRIIYYDTPLSRCCGRGSERAAAVLLAEGADVELGGPLQIAAAHGNLAIVRSLLEHRAAVNAVDARGSPALAKAAQEGRFAIVQSLLAHAADPNLAGTAVPALKAACARGDAAVVGALLGSAADVEQCENGRTPLRVAIATGRLDAVRLLCDHGAKMSWERRRPPDAARVPRRSSLGVAPH